MSGPDKALIVHTADALVEAINEREWGVEFSAERSWGDWSDELQDTDTLHVDVVPMQTGYSRSEMASRGSIKHRLTFDIAVRRKFGRQDQNAQQRIERDKIDSLVLLTERLYQWFVAKRPSESRINWHSAEIVLTCSKKALREWRQYLGIVRVTYDARQDMVE